MGIRSFLGKLSKPPKVYNSIILNILGLQVFRIFFSRSFLFFRKKISTSSQDSYIRSLEENGYVIINNFLSEEEHEEIVREFEEIVQFETHGRTLTAGSTSMKEFKISECCDKNISSIYSNIYQSGYLRSLIEFVSAIKIRVPVAAILQESVLSTSVSEDADVHYSSDVDIENVIHQDHVIPVFKAWYYVNDINQSNGAFCYVPKSHLFTYSMLKYEYLKSIFYCMQKKGWDNIIPVSYLTNGRVTPPASLYEELKLMEIPLAAPKNSLVIANTYGLHRRGSFNGEAVRKLVHIDFRRMHYYINYIPKVIVPARFLKFWSE